MKKVIIGSALASVLFLSSMSATAEPGLTLCSTGFKDNLYIYCNGIEGWYHVPSSPTSQQCTPILPWSGIKINFHFSSSLNCVFYHGPGETEENEVGSAHLDLTLKTGLITNPQYNNKKYKVELNPKAGTTAPNITVLISNLQKTKPHHQA